MNNHRQISYGAVLSYILMIINTLYGLILTPYIILSLGTVNYGVYKTIASLTGVLMILDFGIGPTAMRYISKYRASNDSKKMSDFIISSSIQTGIVAVVLTFFFGIIYYNLDGIYRQTMDLSQIHLAKEIYVLMASLMLINLVDNLLIGIISGHNNFIFSNTIRIVKIILRVIFVFIFLRYYRTPLVLVTIDIILSIFFIIIEVIWVKTKLNIKMKNAKFDKYIFFDSFKYSFLMLITTIAVQINGNMDNVLIGSILGSSVVTDYSIALLIFGMFQSISMSISGVMLPTVTEILSDNNGGMEKVKKIVIRVGRIQFTFLGAAFFGFIILGKIFLNLWLDLDSNLIYYLTLLLILPASLELVINVLLSVLRALNLIAYRTYVLMLFTIINFIITYFGLKYFTIYFAAIGTGVSVLFGSVIVMGFYYKKRLNINVLNIYRDIFRGILPSLIITTLFVYFIRNLFLESWIILGVEISIFIIIYLVALLSFGLNNDEKKYIYKIVRRKYD